MLGPLTAGNVWSWSIQGDKPYPFDYHLVFYIGGLIALGGFLESYFIPKRLAYTKKNC
jgi:hypothetical protein